MRKLTAHDALRSLKSNSICQDSGKIRGFCAVKGQGKIHPWERDQDILDPWLIEDSSRIHIDQRPAGILWFVRFV